jgi:CRISPR-associated exonuclease Cas4
MAWNGLTISLLLVFVAMAGLLLLRAQSLRDKSGLPDGSIIYTDTGTWFRNEEPLYSTELRLAGKPDYLVQQENGEIIPVEIKSGNAPDRPWPGHILQLAAYCLLVEDNYGVRPSFGILQYNDDAFTVAYSAELEEDLFDTLEEMRRDSEIENVDRSHDEVSKCSACGFNERCEQALVAEYAAAGL